MDVPTGYYRIDTLDIDTTNLRMKNGKWVGKNDEEASLEKLTAHTFYDVPKKQTK
jgi:hypothetical protein